MSSFLKHIGDKKFYAVDDYFGPRRYGYAEVPEEHYDSPWFNPKMDDIKFMDEETFIKTYRETTTENIKTDTI